MKKGFVLIFSLVVTLCAALVLGAVLSYVATAARLGSGLAAKSSCRLAALSALDAVRGHVYSAFLSHTGNRSLLLRSASLNWFLTAGRGSTAIGEADFSAGSDVLTALARDFPDHTVAVSVAATPEIKGTQAFVTFLATAARRDGRGSATLAARYSFAIDRSPVFDHAYFVNNYGWFEGNESQIVANGDVRANGDMSLSQNPKINGHVYAAQNDELKVSGDIKNGIGAMDSKSTYLNAQYGVTDRARPLQEESGDGGYDAPDVVTTQTKNDRLHAQSSELEMPWISDLNQYVAYGQTAEIQSTLSQGGIYYVDNRTSNSGGANYGTYQGTGPSGDASLPDNGALVLVGTQSNPIQLNGPVVVSNDVVIKGYVTGQGTIYSQRNIHIVGNIQYVNAPSWSNKQQNDDNSSKDLLGLAAKGNIVLGDPTQSSWMSSTLKNCLTTLPYVQQYECAKADDGSWGDGDIGYPRSGETKFCGNYTVSDGGAKVKEEKQEKFHYETTTDRHGWQRQTKVSDGYEYVYTTDNSRKYYDSVVPASALHDIASTITRIDAVLYNNHGIFGNVGACTINGSLVCRNEGIIFQNHLYLNWDSRLFSGSPESVANSLVGMPVSTVPPQTLALQEVPDAWNPAASKSEEEK